ncbi:MAG: hypothetical protein KBT05_06520 [Bacteroidales bacterium]|nr:hypothetical protein [Candidatus Cryptobacteroides caccocaballi]
MRVGISLTRVPGAEIIRKDGERGVFIPIEGNLDEVKHKDGVTDVFLGISFRPSRSRKFSYSGYHSVPRKYLDKAITTPLKGRKSPIAWIFHRHTDESSTLAPLDSL